MRVKINGEYYDFINDISINYKLDSVASAFSFKARFNPENKLHRAIFKPLSYNQVQIYDNDKKLILTGVCVNYALGSSSTRELQAISGYSSAGVLEDISIPYSAYPLEKNNVSLKDIVRVLLQDLNFDFVIDSTVVNDMDLVYEKAVASPTESVKSFISKLASQRNIIVSHNEKGDLVFFKPKLDSKPVLFLNKENTVDMGLTVNGQSMHSEISVIRQPTADNPSVSTVDTIKNELVSAVRPIVKVLSSGEATATKKAADNLRSAELKNISIKCDLKKIEKVKIGDIVEVQNDEISVYERHRFVVIEVLVKETINSTEMSLSLSIPESFNGNEPKNIFD